MHAQPKANPVHWIYFKSRDSEDLVAKWRCNHHFLMYSCKIVHNNFKGGNKSTFRPRIKHHKIWALKQTGKLTDIATSLRTI